MLSDLHIDTETAPESWELAKAAVKAAVAEKPEHIIIAGDLFDSAPAMRRDMAQVEKHLRRVGLWHRDRLTIVVGNHDIFGVPHHGGKVHFLKELTAALVVRAQDSYDTFIEWAGQLTKKGDRLAGDDDLYPIEKRIDHVRLWAVDSTAATTAYSGNGYWPAEDDALLREAGEDSVAGERRVLAIHNAPFEDEEQTLTGLARQEFALGFPRPEYRRLRKFVDDARIETLVCGHVHSFDGGDEEWAWTIGKSAACDVHMVGRTGGVHDEEPCFGLLEVPTRGHVRWRTIEVG